MGRPTAEQVAGFIACSWLLAMVAIFAVQQVHQDLHEHLELPPILHWLRDAAVAVPLAALAIGSAALLVRLVYGRSDAGRVRPAAAWLAWAVLAAVVFAVLSIPGNQIHGLLFGAEEETDRLAGGRVQGRFHRPGRVARGTRARRPAGRAGIAVRREPAGRGPDDPTGACRAGRAFHITRDHWIHARRRRSMSNQDSRASVSDGRGPTRKKEHHAMAHPQLRSPILRRAFATLMSALMLAGMLAGIVAPVPVAAATNHVTLSVVSARTEPLALGGAGVTEGDPITAYKWMINEDNTGTTTTRDAKPGRNCSAWMDAAHTTPNADYPGSCDWASIAGLASSAPVVAQGDRGRRSTARPASRCPTAATSSRCWPTATSSTAPISRLPCRRRPRDRRRCSPARCRRPRSRPQVFADVTRGERPVRPGRGRPAGLRGQDHRLPRPGEHRRLRQPAVHEVPVQRPTTTASRIRARPSSSMPTMAPIVDAPRRQVPDGRHQHGRRRQRDRRQPCT